MIRSAAIKCLVSAFTLFLGLFVLPAQETNTLPPLTLSAARALALKNHPQIAAADYRALAAGEVVKQARSAWFPAANLYGTLAGADSENTRILAGGLNNPSVFDRAAEGIGINQLVTDFGRTANLTASSRFRAAAENENAVATREEILQRVETDYFGVLEAQAVLNVAHETTASRQLLLDQVSILASNKLKSTLDVSFAEVALEEGRLLEQQASNNLAGSLASLSAGMGFHELRLYALMEEPLPAPNDTNDIWYWIERGLRDRPELLSLRNERESATRLARAQRDARLPTIAVTGAAGNSEVHNSRLPDNYAAAGIQFSIPLFSGGLFLARQHEAELRADSSAEMLRAAEDNVIRDVRIAWLNLNTAQQRLRTTEQLLRHASQAFDLAQARYQAGSASIIELSQAQLALTSAKIAQANARYDTLIQKASLKYEAGAISEQE